MTSPTRGRARRRAGQSSRAQVPQQRVVPQREPAAEVRRAARAAGAGLVPIIRSTIDDVPGPPAGGQLVVLQQRLGQRPDLGVLVAVVGGGAQRRARSPRRSPAGEARGRAARRGRRPTASARRAARRAAACSASVSPRNRSTYDGSLAPERNSSSRNCTDWKPLAGASRCRNSRKSCGRHRLQHVDLVDQHPLDHVHPLQQVLGPPQPAAVAPSSIASRAAATSCSSCLNHSS